MPIEHLVSEYFRNARRYGNEDKLRFYSDKRASGIFYKDAIIIQQTE